MIMLKILFLLVFCLLSISQVSSQNHARQRQRYEGNKESSNGAPKLSGQFVESRGGYGGDRFPIALRSPGASSFYNDAKMPRRDSSGRSVGFNSNGMSSGGNRGSYRIANSVGHWVPSGMGNSGAARRFSGGNRGSYGRESSGEGLKFSGGNRGSSHKGNPTGYRSSTGMRGSGGGSSSGNSFSSGGKAFGGNKGHESGNRYSAGGRFGNEGSGSPGGLGFRSIAEHGTSSGYPHSSGGGRFVGNRGYGSYGGNRYPYGGGSFGGNQGRSPGGIIFRNIDGPEVLLDNPHNFGLAATGVNYIPYGRWGYNYDHIPLTAPSSPGPVIPFGPRPLHPPPSFIPPPPSFIHPPPSFMPFPPPPHTGFLFRGPLGGSGGSSKNVMRKNPMKKTYIPTTGSLRIIKKTKIWVPTNWTDVPDSVSDNDVIPNVPDMKPTSKKIKPEGLTSIESGNEGKKEEGESKNIEDDEDVEYEEYSYDYPVVATKRKGGKWRRRKTVKRKGVKEEKRIKEGEGKGEGVGNWTTGSGRWHEGGGSWIEGEGANGGTNGGSWIERKDGGGGKWIEGDRRLIDGGGVGNFSTGGRWVEGVDGIRHWTEVEGGMLTAQVGEGGGKWIEGDRRWTEGGRVGNWSTGGRWVEGVDGIRHWTEGGGGEMVTEQAGEGGGRWVWMEDGRVGNWSTVGRWVEGVGGIRKWTEGGGGMVTEQVGERGGRWVEGVDGIRKWTEGVGGMVTEQVGEGGGRWVEGSGGEWIYVDEGEEKEGEGVGEGGGKSIAHGSGGGTWSEGGKGTFIRKTVVHTVEEET